MWYQVLDKGSERELFRSICFFNDLLRKQRKQSKQGSSIKNGKCLPKRPIKDCWTSLSFNKEGWLNLIRNCEVAGLGGPDNRDGTFVYYISEPVITNDFKGYGALQASLLLQPLTEEGSKK